MVPARPARIAPPNSPRFRRSDQPALPWPHPALQDAHFDGAALFRSERWLAMLEIKAVTAMMARCFTLTKAPGHGPVREKFAFTMMPENLFVNFKRRGPR